MSAVLAMDCLIQANGRSFLLCAYHLGLSGKLKAIVYGFPSRGRLWDSGSLIQVSVVDKTAVLELGLLGLGKYRR